MVQNEGTILARRKRLIMWRDGIHLLEIGKIVLANNFIEYINKYVTRKDFLSPATPFLGQT